MKKSLNFTEYDLFLIHGMLNVAPTANHDERRFIDRLFDALDLDRIAAKVQPGMLVSTLATTPVAIDIDGDLLDKLADKLANAAVPAVAPPGASRALLKIVDSLQAAGAKFSVRT